MLIQLSEDLSYFSGEFSPDFRTSRAIAELNPLETLMPIPMVFPSMA
jgi:hypothetical protein